MERVDALKILEALRSGVPSRKVSALFSRGREEILEEVKKGLQEIQDNGMSRGVIVKGEYGEGKTHLLNQIFNEAHQRNFLVSLIPLSKETPFNHLGKIFHKVASATLVPEALLPGFEFLLSRIRPGSEVQEDLLKFAEQNLHRKLYYVLLNYFRCGETYDRFLLLSDLFGSFIPLPQLRAIHRLNFSEAIKMDKFTANNHIDYFRLLGFMFRRLGFSGWVILFDEAELVGKLGPLQRGRAYSNMWSFIKPDVNSDLQNIYTVFSMASSFFVDVLQEKKENDIVPQKLEAKGEKDQAAKVWEMIRYLVEESLAIRPLAEETIRDILSTVENLHGTAYGWSPSDRTEEVIAHTAIARLRTKIRTIIESLDLEYLYGEKPSISLGKLKESKVQEDEGFFEK